jgi:hypothetical protein
MTIDRHLGPVLVFLVSPPLPCHWEGIGYTRPLTFPLPVVIPALYRSSSMHVIIHMYLKQKKISKHR